MTLISCPIHILVASFFSKILLVKDIDCTAGNIDESIKNAKEGKSQKKAQSAPKFSHLQVKEKSMSTIPITNSNITYTHHQ